MYSCPACGMTNVANLKSCVCGADLTLLQHLSAMADAWFNRALEALAEGAPARALEWLSACCAAQPANAAARRAQAKVWAQLGRWEEARDALDRAATIDPGAPELELIRQALEEAEQKHRGDGQAERTKKKRMSKRKSQSRASRRR